jgi:hypothetical protein
MNRPDRDCSELWFGGNRQQDSKSSPLARLAFNFNSSPMRFDDHFAMKHANAYPLFLGRLERTKEASFHEIMAHAAPVIGHG